MQDSQCTCRLVQICTCKPCKLVLRTDKKKRRLLCVQQVCKSCDDGLCTYQAFCKICCKQAGSKITTLFGQAAAGQANRLGYKRANCRDHQLGSLLQSSQGCQGAFTMLAAFEDIRFRPTRWTVLGFPDHVLASYAQPSPNPGQLQMTTPFPMTLPTCPLPATYKRRHGLHAVNKHLAQ